MIVFSHESLTFHSRSFDLLIGGLMINHFEKSALISTTRPYAYDDLTWCFRKLEPHPLLVNIYLMFSLEVWITQVTIVTATVFLWYLFLRYDGIYWRIQEYLHIGFLIFAMSTVHYRPQNGFVRIVIGIHFLGALLFNIIFCSLWIDGFTKSYNEEQVETIAQAINLNFQFAGDKNLLNLNDNEVFRKRNEIFRYCANIDECLKELRTNDKLAVAVSKAHAQSNPYLDKSELLCFSSPQQIYSYSIVMSSSEKYFYLLPEINRCLEAFIENGFLKKWMNENQITEKIRKKIDKQFSEISNILPNHGFVSLNHMKSSFFHLITGYIFSLAFLVLEITTFYYVNFCKRRKKKVPIIWAILYALADEKRYFFNDKPAIFSN